MIIDSIILEESKIHFPLRTRDLVRCVCERTGKGERTIYRRLEKLKNEGTVCVFNSEKLNSIFQYETHDFSPMSLSGNMLTAYASEKSLEVLKSIPRL